MNSRKVKVNYVVIQWNPKKQKWTWAQKVAVQRIHEKNESELELVSDDFLKGESKLELSKLPSNKILKSESEFEQEAKAFHLVWRQINSWKVNVISVKVCGWNEESPCVATNVCCHLNFSCTRPVQVAQAGGHLNILSNLLSLILNLSTQAGGHLIYHPIC